MYRINTNTLNYSDAWILLKDSNIVILLLYTIRSWRNEWSWNANVTACPAPAPPRPAGSHCRNSEKSATSSRSATAMLFRWSQFVLHASVSPPFCGSKRLGASRNPLTLTWCIWSDRPTTVKRTQLLGAWAHGAVFAMARRQARTAVAWCAAGEATTRTTTLVSGSATASSTGAAWSSATHATRGLMSLLANRTRNLEVKKNIYLTICTFYWSLPFLGGKKGDFGDLWGVRIGLLLPCSRGKDKRNRFCRLSTKSSRLSLDDERRQPERQSAGSSVDKP